MKFVRLFLKLAIQVSLKREYLTMRAIFKVNYFCYCFFQENQLLQYLFFDVKGEARTISAKVTALNLSNN